ncbi:MAG: transposase [Oscillospiraceae bacterium]
MSKNDEIETDTPKLSKEDIEKAINEIRLKKDEYTELLNSFDETNETQISITDPDSRRMKKADGATDMCYNIQSSVDEKNKLIVDFEVTNRCNDNGLLSDLAKSSKEILEIPNESNFSTVADTGYFNATDINECVKNNITPHISNSHEEITICIESIEDEKSEIKEFSTQGKNVFLKERNIAICPMGQILYPRSWLKSRKAAVYSNKYACNACKMKAKCKKYYRNHEVKMPKSEFTKVCNYTDLRIKQITYKADINIIKQRQSIVEHPFGTIKQTMNHGYCLLKGIENVQGEFALAFLAYNLKRVINLIGLKELIEGVIRNFPSINFKIVFLLAKT